VLSLSDIYGRFARNPRHEAALKLPLMEGAAHLVREHLESEPVMLNIAVSYLLWRRGPRRVVRLRTETAEYLRGVGMGFVPAEPPTTWGGGVLVLESAQREHGELAAGMWSLVGYHMADQEGKARYYWVGLRGEAAYSWSIFADLGALAERVAAAGDLVAATETMTLEDGSLLWAQPTPPERQGDYLRATRFALATSYYLERPDLTHVAVAETPGPPERDARGKAKRAGGHVLPLWTYQDLAVSLPPQEGEPHGPLDKSGLTLKPVLVRPYIRRMEERVIIVDAHGSHRWAHPAQRLGSKIKI
jgi:hypothetical protein